MELTILKAIMVLIGLVLLWLMVKPPARQMPRDNDPGGTSYTYQVPVNSGYPPPIGYQAPRRANGCLQVLAVIGFLAICAACVLLGMALAGNL